ncbi:patatin-like phospholipase family protein [Streptomyces sp. NPDC057238]|uniref:patatin-like phospholipase family protein n=1 Tax=Streptomyces sp. NPDC057238 TaxID=3346060 RepID=UPI0036275AEC
MADPIGEGHDVLDVIFCRRRSQSKPASRRDPHRVALVVEGGGMRGAYTAGMVDALARLGLRDSFDVVYGTSAGAFSALVFAAKGARGASSIYPEFLSGAQFISYRRLRSGSGPLMNLRYLTDEVLTCKRPLDFDEVCDGDISVRLVATSLASGRPATFSGLRTSDDWKIVLRASACVPLLAGRPVIFRRARWIDGSIGERIALPRAAREGATHVLVLRSRCASVVGERTIRTAQTRVLSIRPRTDCGVGPLTTSAAMLAEASRSGADAVFRVFSRDARKVRPDCGGCVG